SKSTLTALSRRVETYLTLRPQLVRVMHLVDIRHPPTRQDLEVHRWLLDHGLQACVVATKQDKLSRGAALNQVRHIQKALATPAPVLAVSAVARTGLDELWALMEADLAAWPVR
ncbi:MAG: YihA family ribosome biogenesis GTP-binding protein, partial [Alicyclobacillus sp.]|nr:YihA family ribosome biogenesis GTP-binding protein [Alicyclobacillus sp.]